MPQSPHFSPFQRARFLTSSARLDQCPPDQGWEVAFAGRSNAGKSSAINALTANRSLARTSKTPGRTQLINFFELDPERRLVDLPGYGFARVAKAVKEAWAQHLDDYLRHRECLAGLVLVMDVRHPLKPFDQQMIQWSIASEVPLHAILTKADKLSRNTARTTERQVTAELAQRSGALSCQLFSATSGEGLSTLEDKLALWYGLSWSNSPSAQAEMRTETDTGNPGTS